ncbi:MAG: rod shape-determining protein MreD [Bacteroidales bacterium]|nr:rod shape-determining protein MreD [Bacteroidales bacterium]
MTKLALQFILLTLILVLAQVIVFNHVCLFNVAVPFAFIYILLRLPVTLSINWVLTIGFFLGLVVDIFSDTQGMNALACTILAALRRSALRLYFPREEDLTDPCPSIHSLGFGIYLKYAVTATLIFCILIFLIASFSLFNPLMLLLRIVCSTLLTTLLLICIDIITPNKA